MSVSNWPPIFGLGSWQCGGVSTRSRYRDTVGGLEGAKALYDANLVKRLVNIGDTRTLCGHPASATHRQMTSEEQLRAGVRAETIRLSDRVRRRGAYSAIQEALPESAALRPVEQSLTGRFLSCSTVKRQSPIRSPRNRARI
jgi:hypothetical protein